MMNLEWIPYIIILIGLYLAGKKNKPIGWIIQLIGCIIFMIIAIYFQIWGIVIGNMVFGTINLLSYLEQRKLKNATLISK